MRMRAVAAVLVLVGWSAAAQAQEEEESAPLSAAPIDQHKTAPLQEVEHGFYLGAEAGLQLYVAPPGGGSMAAGQSGGIEIGYEPMPLFDVGLTIWGANASTSGTYTGTTGCTTSTTNCPITGNFSTLTIGANARLNISLGADSNNNKRTYFYVRLGAGYALTSPSALVPSEGMVFAGPGIEYFTHLRHFSIGAEADGTFGLSNHGFAVLVQPVLRYQF